MKLKLDENLPPSLAEPLKEAGHDVHTVVEERLGGHGDLIVLDAARLEERCFVTLDLDFANVLSYPPTEYFGVVVLRHPAPTVAEIGTLMSELL